MMMLEYDAKCLLASVGVNVPTGTIWRRGEAPEIIRIPEYPIAVKAQVRSGGRGKQGGVQQVKDATALAATANKLFETEFGGEKPTALLIEPWLAIEREAYLSVAVDGRADGYVVMYAPRGGVDIEAGEPPVRYAVGAPWNFRVHRLREVLEAVEPDYQWREKVIALAQRLVRTAASHDCTTIEINPLVKLADGAMIAGDAKIVRDEWAAFRNTQIRDEREAEKQRANRYLRACMDMQHMYVRLDGDIGIISGGAGMTMAAMDMIAEYGGRPACFLDCSPGPTSTRGYRPAFAMLDADPKVKVILVSVFGGGTQMQRVANSMKEVRAERKSGKPVVYRLDGTNVDQVPGIFAQFGAHNHTRLEDAVAEAVRLAGSAGMSILLDRSNRVLVQGVTGQMGTFFVEDARKYGTNMVAGVSPGRAGTTVGDVPVYASVRAAREGTGADTAMVFVPPAAVLGAVMEAIEGGCRLVVATADEMPVLDAIEVRAAACAHGAVFVGPNTPGLISPGKAKLGFMPSSCYTQGNVGVISRSGSLSYECCKRLTLAGIGQSTVVGIGGDPVKGTTAAEALDLFQQDPETRAVLYLGEIGGSEELFVAEYASRSGAKPVAALIVGQTAPPGKKMGHAAALIGSTAEGHAAKQKLLRDAGVFVAAGLTKVVAATQQALSSGRHTTAAA